MLKISAVYLKNWRIPSFMYLRISYLVYYQMDNLIDTMGYRNNFLHQIVAKPQNLWHKKQGCNLFYPLALYCEKWPKMTLFMVMSFWNSKVILSYVHWQNEHCIAIPSICFRGPWLSLSTSKTRAEVFSNFRFVEDKREKNVYSHTAISRLLSGTTQQKRMCLTLM